MVVKTTNMKNQVKLIIRILLPLFIGGIGWLGTFLTYVTTIPDDAGMRAKGLVLPLLVTLSPVILLVHGCICCINRHIKLNLKYLSVGLCAAFVILTVPFFNRESPLSLKISSSIQILFYLALLWLYAYGLNTTRDAVPPTWKSTSCRIWIATCICLIIGSLAMTSLTLGGIVEHTTWRLYGLPAMSFAWFALIWIIPDYWGKAGALVTAILSFFIT